MSKKISELDDVSALDGSEQLEVVQSGANKKVTVNDLLPVQLQADKDIGLNGHTLIVSNATTINGHPLRLLPGIATIRSFSDTDDGNTGYYTTNSDANTVSSAIYADFNDASKRAYVRMTATETTSLAEYEADKHDFEGAIINEYLMALDFANDGAAASGGVEVGQLYHTSGTIKIRLV